MILRGKPISLISYPHPYICTLNFRTSAWHMKILVIQLCVFVISVVGGNSAAGQDQPKKLLQSLSLEVNGHHGFFIANQPKSQYLRSSHANFVELVLSAQTTGNRQWQIENYYPRIGVGLLYGSPGSEQYLGKLMAIYPFVNFPLIRHHSFYTGFRLGLGAGWIQKPYDKYTNYKNLMISTHINACISMMLQSELSLCDRLSVQAGFSFTHLSNGSVKVPNLGLNMPAISAGMRYLFNPLSKPSQKVSIPFRKKWNYYVYALAAAKQTYPLESPVYLIEILNLETLKSFSKTGRYGAGIYLSYDRSLSKEQDAVPTYIFDKTDPQVQASVYACYEHVIGKLSIPLQAGVYLYNKYRINPMYQNIGVRYHFSPKMIAVLQLKTHLGKADYIQWGLGYKL